MVGDLRRLEHDLVEARTRAGNLARAISVLVWSPHVNPGGGVRLLLSLLPALARHPRVSCVGVASPAGAFSAAERAFLAAAGVEMFDQRGDVTGWPAHECDVVFAPWPHGVACPAVDPVLVCTIQDTTVLDYPELLGAAGTAQEAANLAAWMRRCEATVVSSQSTRRNLTNLFGTIGDRAQVVHHAIRPLPDAVGAPNEDAKALLGGLPLRYIVCATNITPHKNLDNLVQAWARFPRRPEWPLVVCGSGTSDLAGVDPAGGEHWRRSQIAGVVRRSGLEVGTELIPMGYIPDGAVAPLIAGAAGLVMPSFTEGGGSFPVEEALSLGVPVLCSDIPVMREHLSHRTATIGWFDASSPASIVAAMEEFVADYDSRLASARAGRADPRPSWSDVAAAYLEIFAAAVEARAGTGAGDQLRRNPSAQAANGATVNERS